MSIGLFIPIVFPMLQLSIGPSSRHRGSWWGGEFLHRGVNVFTSFGFSFSPAVCRVTWSIMCTKPVESLERSRSLADIYHRQTPQKGQSILASSDHPVFSHLLGDAGALRQRASALNFHMSQVQLVHLISSNLSCSAQVIHLSLRPFESFNWTGTFLSLFFWLRLLWLCVALF